MVPHSIRQVVLIVALLGGGICFAELPAAEAVDFNRDVRPILSDNCYFCHGPDDGHREAELRFDTAEGSRHVIESGEFLRRIFSDEEWERMPPPQAKISLTDAEKEMLKKWVEAGAEYEPHWAFVPLPEAVPLPAIKQDDWIRQPLDRFVLARLEEENLAPSPEATPREWLRRVSLDLTGLPPTAEEVERFPQKVAERGEAAYQEVVDRLLASPAYGEHLAVDWLDAARYADSYGYQSDKLNTQWPYRDWVVQAFNENLPYDKFLTWQLAGDLLENPTRGQRLATAFNRLHRLNNEGGAIFEEWRLENVADRVNTFGTAMLGLTLECARCHDHKFDPISHRDYYSISAFFNSIDENGLYDRTEKVPSPSLLLPTDEQSDRLKAAQQALGRLEKNYKRTLNSAARRFEQAKGEAGHQSSEINDLVIALDFDEPWREKEKDIYYPATENRARTDDLPRVAVEESPIPRLESESPERRAIRFDGERGITIKQIKALDRWTPFSLVVTLREPKHHPLRSVIAQHCGGTDAGFNGWDLTIENGYVESRLYRVWPGNGIGVRTSEPIPEDQWVQLTASYDGSSRAEGLKLYLNGKPLATETLRDKFTKSANLFAEAGGGLVIGQRFRSRGFTNGLIDDVRFYSRTLAETELRHLATGSPIEFTLGYFQSAVDTKARAALEELLAARVKLVAVEEEIQEVPVMEELPEPRPAHILARGQYDAPTSDETLVTRDTFEKISPEFPDELPRNRLGLARWLTDPNHPLTGRVIVNRLWQHLFGAGLVRTPENFGLQGELPTHPQLLDWLARDLIQHGWDLKRFSRNVVLSATYRQRSTVTPELLERDPQNRLLARGPAHRLSAEQIRDLALAASGLLNPERGGEPVSPYQPGEDLWKESNVMSPPYEQSVGESLYRRSIYSVWKRTAPLPNMMAFDTTSREVCTVRRSRTNTPLQALVLLNDVQFVEAARKLATETVDQHEQDEARIAHAFFALASREPDATERKLLLQLLEDERRYYQAHLEEARRLIELGDFPVESELAPEELAAMTVVCQAILNLDATIWKR